MQTMENFLCWTRCNVSLDHTREGSMEWWVEANIYVEKRRRLEESADKAANKFKKNKKRNTIVNFPNY